MQRGVERALVAKVGTLVFAGILGLPVTLPASGTQVSLLASAATGSQAVSVALPVALSEQPVPRASVVARDATEAETITHDSGSIVALSAPELELVPMAAPAAAVATPGGSIVLASWYGPGFYGNRTACGQTYGPEVLGVAHLTLPCGSLVTLTSPAGRTVTVPVIDRGPYVTGRTLDLSRATKLALACNDLCSLRMSIP